MTVLLLGGTAEARRLAGVLAEAGVETLSSLAGAVREPQAPPGNLRVGGFGGAGGLADYLSANRLRLVVDATHPFAARISANAALACGRAGVPLLRLSRPGWAGRPDAASWHWVDSLTEARPVAERLGERVFLSTGRKTIADFLDWRERYVLVRVVDEPAVPLPAAWELILDRGPFEFADELELLASRRIGVLVTKDSGGSSTAAKLDAAADLGVPVVVVRRPPPPAGIDVVTDVAGAVAWVTGRLSG